MSQTTRSLGVSASLALALAVSPLFGAAYQGSAYEGFNYTSGATMDATFAGGTGWNAAGDSSANTTWGTATPFNASGNRVITTGGLTSPNAGSPAGIGNAVLISGAGQIGRTFGQTIDSGTFYFSYLTEKTVAEVRTVNFAFFNGTSERLSIGQIANNTNTRNEDGVWQAGANANSGNFSVLVSNSANSPAAAQTDPTSYNGVYLADTPVAYAVNQTFLVVGKVTFNASGADSLQLYINPTSLTTEPSLAYLDLQGIDFGAFTGFRMFAGATQTNQTVGSQTGLTFNASAAKFDEIRFGTTYLSVTGASPVPEPSSFAALLGLAGLGFAASRRRRA